MDTSRRRRVRSGMLDIAAMADHADRNVPLKNYCTALLLPGERKSVEPMAARLAPESVRRMHQSLHHVVADAPWSDEAVLDQCLDFVLPVMGTMGGGSTWRACGDIHQHICFQSKCVEVRHSARSASKEHPHSDVQNPAHS